MVVAVTQNSYVMIPLDRIISTLPVRRLSTSGVRRIQASMERSGFLENFPLVIAPIGDGTYQLIEGRHRLEAAIVLNISPVPCMVKYGLSESERFKLALQCNDAAETMVPSTLVTYAEFVWARTDGEYTQQQIAAMLGWSRSAVSDYIALRKICKDAWETIAATFEPVAADGSEPVAAIVAATAAFTEGLLRSILDLTPEQQLELVQALAHPDEKKRIKKGRFTELAKAYAARNEMKKYALALLGELGEPYTTRLKEGIDSGSYDAEWAKSQDAKNKEYGQHPSLDKLINAIKAEWEHKNSIHLVSGDFYEEVKKIGNGSIDLIITDPPYNIARENEFEYEGRSNVSQDFGDWDKYEHQAFIALFDNWASEWKRILKAQGSGYVFTSDRYISHLREALERTGLHVKATIVWHKSNPGTQPVKTNFKSSVEYILFFTNGTGGHTFHWQGENEMHNFIESPICEGKERILNAKKENLHPTQKPEQIIRHLMAISSNRGDTVFDGFMGVGTTGAVAKEKEMGRKFIGIEQDKTYYDAAVRRLAE